MCDTAKEKWPIKTAVYVVRIYPCNYANCHYEKLCKHCDLISLQDSRRSNQTCWSSRTLFKRCVPRFIAEQLWSVSIAFRALDCVSTFSHCKITLRVGIITIFIVTGVLITVVVSQKQMLYYSHCVILQS